MTKIAVFVGSLQQNSLNKKLARAMEELAPASMEFEYININLPLFNQDLEGDFPAEAKAVKEKVEAADGVLFITPEYNRSLPGVLKNAIDWASRPWGTNSFAGKPAGIVGASVSPTGTTFAQASMRQIAAFLEMKMMGQPEVYVGLAQDIFDENGALTDERWRKNLAAYMEAFATWVDAQK